MRGYIESPTPNALTSFGRLNYKPITGRVCYFISDLYRRIEFSYKNSQFET